MLWVLIRIALRPRENYPLIIITKYTPYLYYWLIPPCRDSAAALSLKTHITSLVLDAVTAPPGPIPEPFCTKTPILWTIFRHYLEPNEQVRPNQNIWAGAWQMTCAPSVHPVWSECSMLAAAWRTFGSLAIHKVHSQDSDQTGWMQRSIVGFVMCRLIYEMLEGVGNIYQHILILLVVRKYHD